jgi:mRNA interferase MazF
MSAPYIPDAGDIVRLNANCGSDAHVATKNREPAVVLSPKAYNSKTGLLVCVPITNQIKGYPFEVRLSSDEVSGAALADQVKSLDWRSRQARYKGKISIAEIQEIKAKLAALLTLV